MLFRKTMVGVALLSCVSGLLFAQQDAGKARIKNVPAAQISPVSGSEMFREYCASCHGKNGKGDGPATPALTKRPTDLTTLAKSNNGRFPELRVQQSIKGDSMIPAHGSKEMPIWGTVFVRMAMQAGGKPETAEQRVYNLTKYIETLQVK